MRVSAAGVTGAALAVVLLVGSGVAVGATVASSPGKVCANKKTGALRLAKRCARTEKAVTLPGGTGTAGGNGAQGPAGQAGATGKTGPQGPVGQTGAAGQQGPPGTNGTNGSDGTQGDKGDKGDQGNQGPSAAASSQLVTAGAADIGGNSYGSSTATCPSGTEVLGTGYYVNTDGDSSQDVSANFTIQQIYIDPSYRSYVRVYLTTHDGSSVVLHAQAICG